jgi:hypothetical protein
MEFSFDRLTFIDFLRVHCQGLLDLGYIFTIFGLWVCLDQVESIDHLLESHRVVRGEI